MDLYITITAPLDHPCYAGHFPGNAVLPGVLLLELVIEALKRAAPRAITSVKFHRALQPGESCALSWKETGDQLHFRCEREAMLIAEGSFMAAAPP